ncbi:hypothetical protein ABF87_03610 [Nitrosomonas sp. JL21]|uniref:hypothetical protein n=1 Tax=Nitrosomonas sp. JL21 TaxID=153949 RepID=UPI0013686B6B|nr:hypothetical protein [Nitrosomonas sp. JL21]MXS77058.1 hypothetical protein [Nitrosomonas sp. JL21]
MANQSLLLAKSIERHDNTDWVRAFLNDLTPKTLLDEKIWPKLRSMMKLIPQGDILPARACFAAPSDSPNIAVTPVFSAKAIWYT